MYDPTVLTTLRRMEEERLAREMQLAEVARGHAPRRAAMTIQAGRTAVARILVVAAQWLAPTREGMAPNNEYRVLKGEQTAS